MTNPIQDPIITASQPNTSASPTTFTFLSNINGPSANVFQQVAPDTSAIGAALGSQVNVAQAQANLANTAFFLSPPPASDFGFGFLMVNTPQSAAASFYPDASSVVNNFFQRLVNNLQPNMVVAGTTTIPPFGQTVTIQYGVGTNATSGAASYYNNFPTTWQAFLSLYNSIVGSGAPVSTANPIYQAFFNSYLSAMGISTTAGGDPITGDGSVLTGFNPPVTAAQLQTQFQNAFNFFLQDYSRQSLFPSFAGSAPSPTDPSALVQPNLGTEQQFLANWASYMTRTAALTTAQGNASGLDSYQNIWNAAGLPASGFVAALQTFYNQTLKDTGKGNPSNGFFIPSQALSSWTSFVQKQQTATVTKSTVSLVGGSDVVVVNRILFLLVKLIGTLQNISASQAGYLNFLTSWQTAYTNELANLPTFVPGDGTILGKSDSGTGNARNNISPKMQALSQMISSRQSAVGDQAKSMQSLINQSQSNSNSAVDMATAFLTELSTILQAIFSKAA